MCLKEIGPMLKIVKYSIIDSQHTTIIKTYVTIKVKELNLHFDY